MEDTAPLLYLDTTLEKSHPWRLCPARMHYVKEHSEHISPSKKHPEGEIITRKAHCALNPSHKDVLSFDEIQAISNKYFADLSGPPTANVLTDVLVSGGYFVKK